MRLFLCFVAVLALLKGTTAFGTPPRPTTTRTSSTTTTATPLWAQKKQPPNKKTAANTTKNPVKEMLKMMITGSPDGVAIFGKPQHDWSGKGPAAGGTSNPTVWGKKKE